MSLLLLALLTLGIPMTGAAAPSPVQAPPGVHVETGSRWGEVTRWVDERGDFRYRYDAQGRLVEVVREGRVVARLAYGADDRMQTLVIESSDGGAAKVLHLAYDARGRMVRMTLEGRGVVKVRHRADGETVVKTKLDGEGRLAVFGMMGTLGMLMQHAGIKVKTGA